MTDDTRDPSDDSPAETPASSESTQGEDAAHGQTAAQDDGPGWMPAILAATVLLGMFGFICCGGSTWYLYQQRTALAVRTLEGSYIPGLEQSFLDPREKKAVVEEVRAFADDLKRGKHEAWQAVGVLQRLQRLPVLQWGELTAVQRFLEASELPDKEPMLMGISRLRRAVDAGSATSLDFEDVLAPVMIPDRDAANGRRLDQAFAVEDVREVARRANLIADRCEIPERRFECGIDKIVAREIDLGIEEGGF